MTATLSPVNAESIPEPLRVAPRWLCWKRETRDGSPTKTPRHPESGKLVDVTRRTNLVPFDVALEHAARFDGVGFVLGGGFAGIDLDNAFAPDGKPWNWARYIIDDFASYTEVSPSGNGIHILLRGEKPSGPCRRDLPGGHVEMYDRGRFFTVTGERYDGAPGEVLYRERELQALHGTLFPPEERRAPASPPRPVELADGDLLNRMFAARNGAEVRALWSGDTAAHGGDDSRADLALCSHLAFWTGGDAARIDALFRQSGLYREKWERADYREGTIAKALEGAAEFYSPAVGHVPSGAGDAQYAAVSETVPPTCIGTRAIPAEPWRAATDEALVAVREALADDDAPSRIWGNQETLGALALVREKDPATWGHIKAQLKGRVNLNDLERATRATALRLASDDDEADRIPRLLEDGSGYTKQRITESGPEAEPLSNFLLTVHERLTLPEGEEVIAVAASFDGGAPRSLDLSHSALLGRRDLLEHLRTSEAVWLGTDRDVQLLRAHLLRQDAPRLQAVEVMGRHGGGIVLPGLTMGCDGPMEPPDTRLVDLEGHVLFSVAPHVWPTPEDHLAAATAVYQFLPGINQAHIAGGLVGWTLALPWAALIRTSPGWGGFPHLVLWGTSGSGKTATAKTAWRLCGVRFDFEPFSLPGTRFTRLRKLACTNLVPIVFDEYRPGSWRRDATAELHHELRSLYGGELEERGTRALGSQKYHLSAPLILVGEDRPRDTALDQRMVVLHPDPDVVRTESFARPFAELHRAPLEAFCLPYWAWALAQDDWSATLGGERDAIRQWAQDQRLSLPPRVLNNLAIVRLGWTMFRRYAEHLGLTPADLVDGDFPAVLSAAAAEVVPTGGVTTALDDLMRFVAVMVANGRLRYGVHFVEIGAGLVLPLREVLAEARRYARETEREQPLLGEDAYRGMVAEAAGRPNGYVIANSGRGDFYNPSGGGRAQRRGVLIDVGMLDRKLEIDPEIWDEPTALPDQGPGK